MMFLLLKRISKRERHGTSISLFPSRKRAFLEHQSRFSLPRSSDTGGSRANALVQGVEFLIGMQSQICMERAPEIVQPALSERNVALLQIGIYNGSYCLLTIGVNQYRLIGVLKYIFQLVALSIDLD